MKHTCTLVLLSAASTLAWAQSSVTMFGTVDLAARRVKNGGESVSSLSSSGLDKSRIGVRGVEDLGDGFKASFWLESGINPDPGTQFDSTRFWNRRSTLSLIGRFGEVRLGRDFTPTYTAWSGYDSFGTSGVGSSDRFISTLGTAVDTLVRSDNMVSYFTPTGLGGFYGQVSVAAGEGAAGKKYYGGRAGYSAGAVDVQVSYGQTTVAPNTFGEDKFKVASIGGSYDFGVVQMLGYWAQMKYADLKLAAVNIGALVPLGPGKLRVSYVDANASGRTAAGISTDANDARQFALGYVYDLSKRTSLYASASRLQNKGAATFSISSPPAQVPGTNSTGYELGMRHRF